MTEKARPLMYPPIPMHGGTCLYCGHSHAAMSCADGYVLRQVLQRTPPSRWRRAFIWLNPLSVCFMCQGDGTNAYLERHNLPVDAIRDPDDKCMACGGKGWV